MKSGIHLGFHTLIFVTLSYTIYYDTYYVDATAGSPLEEGYNSLGGRFKFLTFINATLLQVCYFGLCILDDIFGSKDDSSLQRRRSLLRKFIDLYFTSLVFPIGVFVSTTFWGLYTIDRNLIYPPALDDYIPGWANHCYHTLILISVLVEMFLTYHHFQKGICKYIPIIVMDIGYILWVQYIAYKANYWVYPILKFLSFVPRNAFLIVLNLPPLLYLYLGEKMQNLIWGNNADLKNLPTRQTEQRPERSRKNK